MRYIITDEIWDVMGPMVERCKSPNGPEPDLPDRMFFEAVLHIARTGEPWRDLPEDFGSWDAIYARLRRWTSSRRLEKLFAEMVAQPACEGTVRVMIDSTIVRAHQHSAGALEKKGGAAAQAIGRSRGGPSTKIVTVVSDEDTVVAVTIAEGQRSDAVLAKPALEQAKKIMGRIDEVLGDKGFDSDEIRGACLDDLDALPVIPNRRNRKNPWPWDEAMKETYKQRDEVERSYGKAKQFRRFATRYEKLGEMFLGFVRLVFGFIHIKQTARSVNTL